ncbi:toxin-activating lysine-acyltransferase [uncultured Tateyamaria sp.]|uniref:toxin-activating lysine-acyltransferase n=1 Tax=uncultured Tateyamaria sp. TaxID=455651 RepID=UPI0034432941
MIADYHSNHDFDSKRPARSECHQNFQMCDNLEIGLLTSAFGSQMRFCLCDDSMRTAMVTWVWVFDDIPIANFAADRTLPKSIWGCGDTLFFIDLITPYGNPCVVSKDMSHTLVLNEPTTSLPRIPESSVRRINPRKPRYRNTTSDLTPGRKDWEEVSSSSRTRETGTAVCSQKPGWKQPSLNTRSSPMNYDPETVMTDLCGFDSGGIGHILPPAQNSCAQSEA